MPVPVYGFLEGDTMGLLILADEMESVQSLADKLQEAASLRVNPCAEVEVVYHGAVLDPLMIVAEAGLAPLQRFDVRRKHALSKNRDAQ